MQQEWYTVDPKAQSTPIPYLYAKVIVNDQPQNPVCAGVPAVLMIAGPTLERIPRQWLTRVSDDVAEALDARYATHVQQAINNSRWQTPRGAR